MSRENELAAQLWRCFRIIQISRVDKMTGVNGSFCYLSQLPTCWLPRLSWAFSAIFPLLRSSVVPVPSYTSYTAQRIGAKSVRVSREEVLSVKWQRSMASGVIQLGGRSALCIKYILELPVYPKTVSSWHTPDLSGFISGHQWRRPWRCPWHYGEAGLFEISWRRVALSSHDVLY